ncbi:MAG: ROK family protein [Nitriliruptoraceae bacterium]|nr:ROK family protein [Nitriliruptoraceae bacterium]
MRTIGIDLGGTNASAVVLDDERTIGHAKRKTPADGGRDDVVAMLAKVARDALDDADLDATETVAVGVGTPGIVVGSTVGNASNVPGFDERFDLGAALEEALELPIRLVNDVTAAAVGEHRLGGGVGVDDLLAVFVGTGVGGGLVLRGEPYEGAHGGAGEFGHLVIRPGGAACPGGRRGGGAAYAGGRAMEQAAERARVAGTPTVLFEVMEEKGKQRATSGVFKTALERGDELVADLIDDAIEALGAGIASAVNLLDLDLVVIGGGLADKLGAQFLDRVDAAARPHLFRSPPAVEFVAATLGDDGGAVGAALLAREVA